MCFEELIPDCFECRYHPPIASVINLPGGSRREHTWHEEHLQAQVKRHQYAENKYDEVRKATKQFTNLGPF